MIDRPYLALVALALAACVHAPEAAPVTPVAHPVALAEGAPRAPLAWAELSPATFAKAKAERRYIVLDGSAEWCHWCHVMEATTYHDETVQGLLAAHFIAVKVDVDAHPDIEERYEDWGWPATVIFSPDAEEIGKYRGYIAPADFADILRVVAAGDDKGDAAPKIRLTSLGEPRPRLDGDELAYIERDTEVSLDEYYDDTEGGWGRSQKAPIAEDNAWALDRAREGDLVMKERALFTLEKQVAVIDPVWGGIYQYSVGRDWTKPHFEKLMPFEAGALENYAEAYALTGGEKWLALANTMRRYMDSFLLAPDGAFYASQDADLNAHDPDKPFLSGHDFYPLSDAERRAHGVPRVDTHEYAYENGLAIAAYVSLYDTAKTAQAQALPYAATALATAKRAADRILETHLSPRGGVTHDQGKDARSLHLADNATFAYALLRLYEATHEEAFRTNAETIARFIEAELLDPSSHAFFGSTRDPDAVGVFAKRRTPFEENVAAVRLFTKLAQLGHEDRRASYQALAEGALAAIARPEEIHLRGRMIGSFLSSLEDVRKGRLAGAPVTPHP